MNGEWTKFRHYAVLAVVLSVALHTEGKAQTKPAGAAKGTGGEVSPNAVCLTCNGGGGDPPGGNGTKNDPVPIPPAHYATSPGGVDMRTGVYVPDNLDLAIGGPPSEGGLELRRSMARNLGGAGTSGFHQERMGSFTHNWDDYLSVTRLKVSTAYSPGDYDIVVTENIGGLGSAFRSRANPISFTQVSPEGIAQIAYISDPSNPARADQYSISKSNGVSISYRSLVFYDCQYSLQCSYPAVIKYGNGVRFDLEYDNLNGTGDIYHSDQTRLRAIVSNKGYAILLEYGGANPMLVSKACALNLAILPKPSSYRCPVGTPTVTYNYDGSFMTSYIDVTGAAHNFTKSGSGSAYSISFYDPGSAAPYLANTYNEDSFHYRTVTGQTFADGRSYAYTWDRYPTAIPGIPNDPMIVAGGSFTDNTGHRATVYYGHYADENPNESTDHITSSPESLVDELGRTTAANYCFWQTNPTTGATTCNVGRQRSVTDPEGSRIEFTYDYAGNITQQLMVPKPGSSLANIGTSATFDCNYFASCTKPTSVVAAGGATTNYTYDPVHGGVLSESLPADGSGVRAVKRYGYAQRYAWLSSGAGGYVPAASPVWVLSAEKTCRSSATTGLTINDGCAGGVADEVVTTYDYGPDSGPNNLLLRGKVVTASGVSLRTCYGYDAQGNKISETSPRAGLAVCP